MKSFIYVTKIGFGDDPKFESYFYGNNKQFATLFVIFFYIAIVLISIGLLNILIALMGSTYNKRI